MKKKTEREEKEKEKRRVRLISSIPLKVVLIHVFEDTNSHTNTHGSSFIKFSVHKQNNSQ